MAPKVYVSSSTNIFENLALESVWLRDSTPRLLLYKCSPCVVWGKFQNPWREVDIQLMRERGLLGARRISGGGCVFHDEGNLNFAFFEKGSVAAPDRLFNFINSVLKRWELELNVNERNDLTYRGKKVSGSAFRRTREQELHHCTLLIDAEISRLKGVLHSPLELSIEGRFSKSVRSQVLNLSQVVPSLSVDGVISEFSPEVISPFSVDGVQVEAARLAADDFVFEETPPFFLKTQLSFAGIDFKIEKGRVIGHRFHRPDLHPELLEEVCRPLLGVKLLDLPKLTLTSDIAQNEASELHSYFVKHF